MAPRPRDWGVVTPFFMSAAFYLTALFALLAPLPLLLTYFRKGRGWALLACLINAGLVFAFAGSASLVMYTVTIIGSVWLLGESINRKLSVEKTAGIALFGIALMAGVVVLILGHFYHLDLLKLFHNQVLSMAKDWVEKTGQPLAAESQLFSVTDFKEWKDSLWIEFWPALVVTLVALIWANLVLLLKANPGGVRERLALSPTFLSQWKAPEYLVWPTIAAGFFLLFEVNGVSEISRVVFQFLMAVYAIQGLSILSSFFNFLNVRGWLRVLGYSFCLGFFLPLVLILGFFDLWFDFRGKFRQS